LGISIFVYSASLYRIFAIAKARADTSSDPSYCQMKTVVKGLQDFIANKRAPEGLLVRDQTMPEVAP
jgi:hypothetical protein